MYARPRAVLEKVQEATVKLIESVLGEVCRNVEARLQEWFRLGIYLDNKTVPFGIVAEFNLFQ